MSHESNDPKDDKAGKEAGHAVAAADHDGVAEHVVLELVVAGEGDHAAPGDAQREEDLDAGVGPNLAQWRSKYWVSSSSGVWPLTSEPRQ